MYIYTLYTPYVYMLLFYMYSYKPFNKIAQNQSCITFL